jgi:hypothetical protein
MILEATDRAQEQCESLSRFFTRQSIDGNYITGLAENFYHLPRIRNLTVVAYVLGGPRVVRPLPYAW